jgi:hypothetical protein
MMSKASKEIECLIRLDELISCYEDIMDFLIKEDLLTKEEARGIRSSSEMPKNIRMKLAELSKAKKLQLLEYNWQILPVELIGVNIVTDRSGVEFSYGY